MTSRCSWWPPRRHCAPSACRSLGCSDWSSGCWARRPWLTVGARWDFPSDAAWWTICRHFSREWCSQHASYNSQVVGSQGSWSLCYRRWGLSHHRSLRISYWGRRVSLSCDPWRWTACAEFTFLLRSKIYLLSPCPHRRQIHPLPRVELSLSRNSTSYQYFMRQIIPALHPVHDCTCQ